MGKINPLILEIGIPAFVLGCAGIYYKYYYNTGTTSKRDSFHAVDEINGGKRGSTKRKKYKKVK
jgi:hypothetical protein